MTDPTPPPQRGMTGKLQALRENLAGQLGQPAPEPLEAGPAEPAATEPAAEPAAETTDEAIARRHQEAAEQSNQRMGFIVAYLKDPTSKPYFQDKTIVYQVFAEERTYQMELFVRTRKELEALPLSPLLLGFTQAQIDADERYSAIERRRAELARQLEHTATVRNRLVNLMGKLTGRPVDEASLNYEPEAEITTTEETSLNDAFGAAAQLLARAKAKKPGPAQ